MKSLEPVFSQLKNEGLVDPALDLTQLKIDEDTRSPWFIRALLGGSAWIASLLVLSFIFGFMRINSKEAMIVSGTLMCIAGIIFSRGSIKNEFLNQSLLAISLAGQILFIFGLEKILGWGLRSEFNLYLAVFIFEAILIALNKNFFHRFVSTLISIIALWLLIYKMKIPNGMDILIILLTIATIFIWFTETIWTCRGQAKLYRPVGYAIVISVLFTLVFPLRFSFIQLYGNEWGWMISKIGIIIATLLLTYMILHHYKLEKNTKISSIVFGSVLLIAIPSWQAPGILVAIMVLILGFYRGNRILIGLALPALAFYLSAYYYILQTTLLVKSLYLISAGAAMLIVRYGLLHYFWPEKEVAKNA